MSRKVTVTLTDAEFRVLMDAVQEAENGWDALIERGDDDPAAVRRDLMTLGRAADKIVSAWASRARPRSRVAS